MADAMHADPSVLVFGEDVGMLGGVFRITDGLTKTFGTSRCFDTPLAESGIVGMAVGMAMNGMRPVIEMQFDAFAYPAFEQIVSHVAKLHNRTKGAVKLPMVIRVPYAGGIGGVEHHCDSSEAYYAHTAGLKRASPPPPWPTATGCSAKPSTPTTPSCSWSPRSCTGPRTRWTWTRCAPSTPRTPNAAPPPRAGPPWPAPAPTPR